MRGDRFGDLTHQHAELADLARQRVDGAARVLHRLVDARFNGVEPVGNLHHLAGEVGSAA
jgi:hypothetical protein